MQPSNQEEIPSRAVPLSRWRGRVTIVAVVTIVLSGVFFAAHALVDRQQTSASQLNIGADIVAENARAGVTDWLTPPAWTATTQIQAYADRESVQPGEKLRLFVSVQVAGTPYTARVYRLGWYGGAGARLMLTASEIGDAQGYFDETTMTLRACATCRTDTQTGLVEANWRPSFEFPIPANWVTGIYLAKLTDTAGFQTQVVFVVRGKPHSTYLAVTPSTTVAAYNQWGGYSLYLGPDSTSASRGVKVSLDRPLAGTARRQGLVYEIDAIRWIERLGYDVSYVSDVNLHEHPELLLNHRAYLSLGHDEYWTKEMRDGVERARDAGVNLAFFGSNAAYWQMRFESSSSGIPNRTVVCYKVNYQTIPHPDPLQGVDDERVSTLWRAPPLNRPENALIGVMYSNYDSQPQGFAWRASAAGPSRLLAGTGIIAGQDYGCDIVGYEWDKIYGNGATPRTLHVLSASPTVIVRLPAQADVSNSVYYTAASGALVFASGSIHWAYALDGLRLLPDANCAGREAPVPQIQRLMANVMDALAVHAPAL